MVLSFMAGVIVGILLVVVVLLMLITRAANKIKKDT